MKKSNKHAQKQLKKQLKKEAQKQVKQQSQSHSTPVRASHNFAQKALARQKALAQEYAITHQEEDIPAFSPPTHSKLRGWHLDAPAPQSNIPSQIRRLERDIKAHRESLFLLEAFSSGTASAQSADYSLGARAYQRTREDVRASPTHCNSCTFTSPS